MALCEGFRFGFVPKGGDAGCHGSHHASAEDEGGLLGIDPVAAREIRRVEAMLLAWELGLQQLSYVVEEVPDDVAWLGAKGERTGESPLREHHAAPGADIGPEVNLGRCERLGLSTSCCDKKGRRGGRQDDDARGYSGLLVKTSHPRKSGTTVQAASDA